MAAGRIAGYNVPKSIELLAEDLPLSGAIKVMKLRPTAAPTGTRRVRAG